MFKKTKILKLLLIFCLCSISGCQSLHKTTDPEAVLKACQRESDLIYRNRSRSRNAQKLYRLALKACEEKFNACLKDRKSKKCQRFNLRYVAEYSKM